MSGPPNMIYYDWPFFLLLLLPVGNSTHRDGEVGRQATATAAALMLPAHAVQAGSGTESIDGCSSAA